MGQYWIPVNLDKKEFIHPHRLGNGLKLAEQVCSHPGTGAALLILTAAMPVPRGGGDLDLEDNWHGPERKFPQHNNSPGPMPEAYPDIAKRTIGRWAGDRIALVGDYAEDSDLPAEFEASKIYNLCNDPDDRDEEYLESLAEEGITPDMFYTDISADVAAVIEHEMQGSYIGDGWRQFVDVDRDELFNEGDVIVLFSPGHAFRTPVGVTMRGRNPLSDSRQISLPAATELEVLSYSLYHFHGKIVACAAKGYVGKEVFVDRDQLPRYQRAFDYIQALTTPPEGVTFDVPSSSGHQVWTLTNPLSDDATCTCPDFEHRQAKTGGICKHIAAFRQKAGV